MAIDIDSDAALETLEELFADVQNQLMAQTAPSFAPELVPPSTCCSTPNPVAA